MVVTKFWLIEQEIVAALQELSVSRQTQNCLITLRYKVREIFSKATPKGAVKWSNRAALPNQKTSAKPLI